MTEAHLFCSKCGAQNAAAAQFCTRCGALLGGLPPAITTGPLGIPATSERSGGVCSALVSWIYEAALESSPYQATLGKMALGMKVTDLAGNRISFARATGRHFAKYVSGMI